MTTKKTSTPPVETACSAESCPKCGCQSLAGEMGSFWVNLKEGTEGEPDGEWADWSANTELTERRLCHGCGYEFGFVALPTEVLDIIKAAETLIAVTHFSGCKDGSTAEARDALERLMVEFKRTQNAEAERRHE